MNISGIWPYNFPQFQIQFFLITTHWMVLYFMSCNYPKFVIIVLVPQNLFMFALFTDFYIKAYIKKKPAKVSATPEESPAMIDKEVIDATPSNAELEKEKSH